MEQQDMSDIIFKNDAIRTLVVRFDRAEQLNDRMAHINESMKVIEK